MVDVQPCIGAGADDEIDLRTRERDGGVDGRRCALTLVSASDDSDDVHPATPTISTWMRVQWGIPRPLVLTV